MVADVSKRAQRRAETQRIIDARQSEALRMSRKDDLTGNPVRRPVTGKLATESAMLAKAKPVAKVPRKKNETGASAAE